MENLQQWLNIGLTERGESWEKNFLAELAKARVKVVSPEPRLGPDRWPYLSVSTGEEEGSEPISGVLNWLSSRGIGLVINAHKTAPDYVLTYGMIWNFRERNEFFTALDHVVSGPIEIQKNREILAGPPSEAYLPTYVRAILKRFLGDQRVMEPKTLMVSFDKKHFDLCFSIESLNSPPSDEHAGIAEAMAWFLPAHFSVALISEQTIPGFVPL